jgi:HEAT repeat protein
VDLLDAPYKAGTNLTTIAKAIDAAGTNALPFLVKWIHYEPSSWSIRFVRLLRPVVPWSILESLACPPRSRLACGSVLAFRQLGSTAAPAIPELARLANNPASRQTAWSAILALTEIGTNSLPVLQQIIENPQHPQRVDAAYALTTRFPPPTALIEPSVPPDQTIVCVAATILLGEWGRHGAAPPPDCVPALTNCLHSTNRLLRIEAIEALGKLGTNSIQAIAHLAKMMKGPDAQFAARAFTALNYITPGSYTNSPTPRQ